MRDGIPRMYVCKYVCMCIFLASLSSSMDEVGFERDIYMFVSIYLSFNYLLL